LEEANVLVGDERAVGLNSVAAVPLESPRPEVLEIFHRHQERLAAEQAERAAFRRDRVLDQLQVVPAIHVSGVSLGVLVAVLAADVALTPERSDLDGHGASPWRPGRSPSSRLSRASKSRSAVPMTPTTRPLSALSARP